MFKYIYIDNIEKITILRPIKKLSKIKIFKIINFGINPDNGGKPLKDKINNIILNKLLKEILLILNNIDILLILTNAIIKKIGNTNNVYIIK